MTIRITRNAAGNCLNFIGSSMPAYFNACLSGQVDSANDQLVSVVNDIQTANDPNGEFRYEFFQIPYTDFADKDGNSFASAQEAADYITQEGNVLGVSDVGTSLNGVTVNFRLDQTNTSIIMDNGAAFGVNTIKAVADTDGTIHIHAIGAGVPEDSSEPDDHKHFEGLEANAVQINGVTVPGGINDVVNALNELFTVGPFESVVVADPYSTMIADVNGVPALYTLEGSTAVDPAGNDVFGNTGSGNYAGLKSTATIDQAGEYFTFDIRVEGQIGFGLVHSDASYAANKYQGNATYANPASFAVGNSAHYGYQFSHWFHPTPNGSWTNYGASTGFVRGPGWSNWDQRQDWLDGNPVKIRVGIDENGFIAISSLQDDGSWTMHARSSYPVPEGSEFHLGIKAAYPEPRVFSAPQVHLLEPAAPTLYFRYIESPDGYYSYPLFATQEEADYYEEQVAGAANGSHTHVYPDDPSNTTWYMPSTAHQMNYGLTPVEDGVTTFMGNPIAWTEITSLTNADLAPAAFTGSLTVDEGASVNYQTQPQDTTYTTAVTGLPMGLMHLGGGVIIGTAPEVPGDTTSDPTATYSITVTRTNNYGSSQGTLNLTVNNLTAPTITAISGVTHEATSVALVDSDTLADGSVVSVGNGFNDGNRGVMDLTTFVNASIMPAINSGTGNKSVWVGFGRETGGSPNWADSVTANDFELAFEFFANDVERANNTWRLRVYKNGVQVANVGVGSNTTGLYNYVFVNDGGTIKIGGLLPSYGDASSFVWNGTSMSWDQEVTGLATQTREIYLGTNGTTLDLPNPMAGFAEVAEPAPAPTNSTSWTKALDFSGSAERAIQVSTSSSHNPLMMGGLGGTVAAHSDVTKTNDAVSGRPWATACVFKYDGHSSNQHIWNAGEGVNADNIYLRMSANGYLYFGWGRDGAGINECSLGGSLSTNVWWGVYIAHNGTRLSGANATAANLADCFDIYMLRLNDAGTAWTIKTGTLTDGSGNRSIASNWTQTGYRMDRATTGQLSIGGRGANRSFHGKVASMVVTTLRRNIAMPTTAEITQMVTDPQQWLLDYKHGQPYRPPYTVSEYTFSTNNQNSATATQVWLMGDGTNDSYSNMIRNQVRPSDQNYTKLNMISMVSNDIETVNISGLS